MCDSLSRNLTFQAVLKPLLLRLGREGMLLEFVILHTILGDSCEDLGIKVLTQLPDQLPFFNGSCDRHSTSKYFHTSVKEMASFLMRSKLVYYVVFFRQQERCTDLLIPCFGGRVCHHMAPIESSYFHYVRQKTHKWGLQIMWTQEKKKLLKYIKWK